LTAQSGSLASALAEAGDWGPFFAVHTHAAGETPLSPWRPIHELVTDRDVLRERVSGVRAYLATASDQPPERVAPRVAASATHLGIVARLVSPFLGAAAHSGRFPAIELADIWWQPELGGGFPLSVPVAEEPDPDKAFLGAVGELGAALGVFSVSERVLWGNVASAVNGAAVALGRTRPDLASRAAAVAAGLLALPPLRQAITRRQDGRFQRSSCCLIYQVSPTNSRAAVCNDCVLTKR
jgi:hypothetical protein